MHLAFHSPPPFAALCYTNQDQPNRHTRAANRGMLACHTHNLSSAQQQTTHSSPQAALNWTWRRWSFPLPFPHCFHASLAQVGAMATSAAHPPIDWGRPARRIHIYYLPGTEKHPGEVEPGLPLEALSKLYWPCKPATAAQKRSTEKLSIGHE